MADVLEYRGVSFSIPPNDDGVWRYRVHPGHLIAKVARPQQAPAEGFVSRDAAIAAAERAIDEWLGEA